MEKSHTVNRRILITRIAILALIQAAILAYLGVLLWPGATPESAEILSTPQFRLPSAAGTAHPTPVELPSPESGVEAPVVGPLVEASNYVYRARGFDPERALEHIAYLTSDELGGRQPGTPGGEAAGEYIAARFAQYGLEPAGEMGSYFQPFTVPYGQITAPPLLTIIPPSGEALTRTYGYRTDYRALTGRYLGAGEGKGPVIWLNRCDHEAFTGQDLVGKIVLCLNTGDPQVYREAIEHQVGGLLLLERERETPFFRRGGYRETAWVPRTIPAYLISEKVVQDLLIGTDYTLDELSLRFSATPLSTTVHMAVTLEEREAVEARNVLGLLAGSDPEHSDEVVIIGAHYDHLGREPDGTVMYGANDNASGVAVMLEIARLWQDQEFRPARSVLFAAWDGEEQGLLGSHHYVLSPTLPLTQTVAMLNLDMVGSGETLQVDGEGDIVAQIQAGAAVYGISTTFQSIGRSDHASFYEAGIPAAMLIWWPDPRYHSTDDTVEAIEAEKLKTVGVLAAHTLAALAAEQVQLEEAVERMRAAIATGNREAFLEGLDPTDEDLRAAQVRWFDELRAGGLAGVSVEPTHIRIGNGEAGVRLTLAYHWSDATHREPTVSYDVRFVERNGVWAFAGYELESLSGDTLTVARFSDVPVGTQQLLSSTQQAYRAIAADLGMEPVTPTHVTFYPNTPTMRAIARPAASGEPSWLVPSAGLAEIAWGQPITPALVSLVLTQMGLPADAAPWLREGLALRYDPQAEREFLPLLAASDVLTSPLSLATLEEVEATPLLRASAWGLSRYLLDRFGVAGLQALCTAWSQAGGGEEAFRQALGLSPGQFEAAWHAERIAPLRADAAAIENTLTARAQAVLAEDAAAFLNTVAADPVLRTEERNWFADLAAHPALSYSLAGRLVDWSPGGQQALVELTTSAVISGGQSTQVTCIARFRRERNEWRYADVAWNEQSSDHFLLKFQSQDRAWAERILELAEAAYTQVTADLGAVPPLPVEIKAYEDSELFRTSIFLSLPRWVTGWTEPGEAIKFWPRSTDENTLQSLIAHELTHQVLFAQGLRSPWLHEGVAAFEAGRVQPLGDHWVAARRMPVVEEAVRRHRELALHTLPSFEDLPDEQIELAYAQSWSMVSFIVERHGLAGLRRLIAQTIATGDTVMALSTSLGVDMEHFQAQWREYVYAGGIPDDLLALARRFDPQRALAHIAVLSSPDYEGRAAGSPGADRAAAYIAEQFAALGLAPLGDPVAESEAGGRGYLQWFPISHTQIITTPGLTLMGPEGRTYHSFTYRADFLESGGEGIAEGELVWVRTDDLAGIRFGGAVVLEEGVDDPVARAAELAEHGASGLVIATDKTPEQLQADHIRPAAAPEAAIPIFEITGAAFQSLLERLGMEYHDLAASPPTLPLGIIARQSLLRSPLTTTLTANVLGWLPGSDPRLAGEVLIIGAHYDHIGRSPDGLHFPGANHNASGVAALLETARLWQAEGYRPARSVLFAAWGAEEISGAGAAYYLAHPAMPITETVGVIALDSIGGGEGYKLLFFGTQEHDLPLIQRTEAAADWLDRRAWRRGSSGEGWHTAFNGAGIPTVKMIWDGAEEDFYLPTDTIEQIVPDRLATSGEILALVASWLAR